MEVHNILRVRVHATHLDEYGLVFARNSLKQVTFSRTWVGLAKIAKT